MYFRMPSCNACDFLEEDFGNTSLGKLYNDAYLSYKLDASGRGKQMAEYFGVFTFPTLLYVDSRGDVKFSARGYRDGKAVFEAGKLAKKPHRDIKKIMDERYKKNPADTDHLYDYIEYQYAKENFKKAKKLSKEYLNQRANIDKAAWMNFVLDYADDTDSYAYEVLMEDKDEFKKEFGDKLIDETIWNSIIRDLSQIYNANKLASFENRFVKAAVEAGYDKDDEKLNLFFSEYLFTNPYLAKLRLTSSDKSLLTKYALQSVLVKEQQFQLDHLVTMGVHLIQHYQKDNAMAVLNDALAYNFSLTPRHQLLDLQSVVLYTLDQEEAAVEKITQARELAIKNGVKSFKPSILSFKKMGIVK